MKSGQEVDHDDAAPHCYARSMPSLRGRPAEFVRAACHSAHALHAAELDACASVTTAAVHSWCPLSGTGSSVQVEAASMNDECARSTVETCKEGQATHEPEETIVAILTWSESDTDDECTTSSLQVSDAGSNTVHCLLVYDSSSPGALLKQHLTHPNFRVTPCFPGAQPAVLWARSTRYAPSSAMQWRHSFHGEEWLTEKDWLTRLVQLTAGRASWFQESFTVCDRSAETGSMRNQLQEFVGAFLSHGEDESATNVWIVKPARLSRSRGVTVADNLDCLLKACDEAVVENTPAVVSRYLLRPALYQGRKFDLRFVVTLRRIHPLLLSIYDGWLVRTADELYSVGDYANKRKHLTVMQYLDESIDASVEREWVSKEQLVEYLKSSFGPIADEQHIQAVCHGAILECFTLATAGIRGHANEVVGIDPNALHTKVRGCYGIDVMLRPSTKCVHGQSCPLEPVILEVNYKPDLRRILREDEEFFDNLFPALFDEACDNKPIPGWVSYEY